MSAGEASCVALSTTEAEYMALSSTAQEAIWMSYDTPQQNPQPSMRTINQPYV